MLSRSAERRVVRGLSRQAAVAVVGPRQVGKTTLALDVAAERDALYLDLESAADRARLSDPRLFLEPLEDRLVVLDEVHRVPGLFAELRGLVDRGRRRGRRHGRFLLLGSASLDLLRGAGDSLAGRIEQVPMGPLTVAEIDPAPDAERLWLRGGFPDSFLAADDADSYAWRQEFVRTYLERDVPQFGPRIPATTLERLWTMLAHSQGQLLNASQLARGLSLSAPTVTGYIDLLADLLLVRRLAPLHANVGKRLVKSPKLYVRDSGLVHVLLGIATGVELAGHPVVGPSWEGHVVENLIGVSPARTRASFYRTAAGAEMDLVLELPGRPAPWAIEIKRGLAVTLTRGFHAARADIAPERTFVVHAGEERYPLPDGVEVIGLAGMAAEIASTERGRDRPVEHE